MNYLFILLAISLMAFTPIYTKHNDLKQVDDEIKNMSDNFQSRQFTVVASTPNYQDIQDGEVVIYSSATINPTISLMLRVGTTLYVSPYFQIMRGR